MSLGYAEKLSYREDVGTVGMSEIFDPSNVLDGKILELALLIQQSKHLVAFTGAGISTSCGIPDFRGPKGIWTLQHEGKSLPEASLPFDRAMPSLTHMALVELERAGVLKFVISQNVDCLHLRSGIPREKLAELHGNSFREICPSCGAEYIRDFEIETIGMKETSRRCSDSKCRARLTDTVLDWEDALPAKEMDAAEEHCRKADVVLCLGTSLQITPACNLPLKAIRNGGKVVIVNLQQTPKDKKASLVIHGRVDKVIAGVMDHLKLQVPLHVRIDLVQICLSHSSKKETYVRWILRIQSIHGSTAPLPFLHSVEVSFPARPELKTALIQKQPFRLKRQTAKNKSFTMLLKFILRDGCGCSHTTIEYPINFQVKKRSISHSKNEVIKKLRDVAEKESSCGQNAIIERTANAKSEITKHAIVTNTLKYELSIQDNQVHEIASNSNGAAAKSCIEVENSSKKPSKRSKLS